jgi:uncharacterized protein YlxW (UPF0749 family)
MKRFDVKTSITIGLVSVVLGMVFSIQYKAVNSNYLEGLFPSQRAIQLENELSNTIIEKDTLQEQLEYYESELRTIKESESKESAVIKSLNDDILKFRVVAGLEDVEGEGIQVIIEDPFENMEYSGENGSVIMYNYDLILSMLNILNAAGAEAVSVNNQRIIAMTEIHLAGNNLNINNVPTAPPFVIKAIGNSDTLEASLNIRYGIVWEMRENYKLQVGIKKFENIMIEKYKDVIKFRYAKPVE